MSPTGRHLAGKSKQLGLQPLILLSAVLLASCFILARPTQGTAAGASPTPEPDPLAVPVLPQSPTEVDRGRVTYYYRCMPCHGDRGQGLTEEWRQVWVEDHQDCWARGCHGGKPDDQGFPIPGSVPPVMPPFTTLADFDSVDALADFLRMDHPPQDPGILDEAECRSLAAYLTRAQSPPSVPEGDVMRADGEPPSSASVGRAAAALLVTLGVAWLVGSREAH